MYPSIDLIQHRGYRFSDWSVGKQCTVNRAAPERPAPHPRRSVINQPLKPPTHVSLSATILLLSINEDITHIFNPVNTLPIDYNHNSAYIDNFLEEFKQFLNFWWKYYIRNSYICALWTAESGSPTPIFLSIFPGMIQPPYLLVNRVKSPKGMFRKTCPPPFSRLILER